MVFHFLKSESYHEIYFSPSFSEASWLSIHESYYQLPLFLYWLAEWVLEYRSRNIAVSDNKVYLKDYIFRVEALLFVSLYETAVLPVIYYRILCSDLGMA